MRQEFDSTLQVSAAAAAAQAAGSGGSAEGADGAAAASSVVQKDFSLKPGETMHIKLSPVSCRCWGRGVVWCAAAGSSGLTLVLQLLGLLALGVSTRTTRTRLVGSILAALHSMLAAPHTSRCVPVLCAGLCLSSPPTHTEPQAWGQRQQGEYIADQQRQQQQQQSCRWCCCACSCTAVSTTR